MTEMPALRRLTSAPQGSRVTHFEIGGMHCAACANRNELALKKLPGVAEAAVNFAMRSARVEFDPSQVSERALHEFNPAALIPSPFTGRFPLGRSLGLGLETIGDP